MIHTRLINSTKQGKNKGFTLLEVVIAVALIGTAMVMLLGSVNNNINLASKSRDTQIAALLAQEMMSEIELEELLYEKVDSGVFLEHEGFKWYLSVSPYTLPLLSNKIMVVRLLITWDNEKESFEIFTATSG